MNSKQEEIVKKLTQKSFGRPFIFAPDLYKKGNAQREPADLVWACNNCIFLFYMKAKENKGTNETNVVRDRKDKLIANNFKQAKGWLDEWRSGRKLIGENEYGKFCISHDDYKYIALISIIAYGNEEGFYHNDYEKELGVQLCATLSQRTFEILVSIDITAVDLILLLQKLKKNTFENNSIQLLSIGQDYYNNAKKNAYTSAKELLPSILPEQELLSTINRVFQDFRSAASLNITSSDPELASMVASIFNDIALQDYYHLIITLSQRIKYHEEDPRRITVYLQELENYVFNIGVAHADNLKIISKKQLEMVHILDELKPMKTHVMIAFETQLPVCILSFKPRIGKSQCEILLENN